MAKFRRFDEAKIDLIMTVRGLSRAEAIAALRCERKGVGGGCKGKFTKPKVVSATSRITYSDPVGTLTAAEFFRED